MHELAVRAIVEVCRKRQAEGDCPTAQRPGGEILENVIVQLADDIAALEARLAVGAAESAEDFARRLGGPEYEWSITPAIAAVEARDFAIDSAARLEGERAGRLAVLDELGGIESIRNLQVELKGAQLMVFHADTPEKRSLAFKCIGGVVSWLMQAESELRSKLTDTGGSDA